MTGLSDAKIGASIAALEASANKRRLRQVISR